LNWYPGVSLLVILLFIGYLSIKPAECPPRFPKCSIKCRSLSWAKCTPLDLADKWERVDRTTNASDGAHGTVPTLNYSREISKIVGVGAKCLSKF